MQRENIDVRASSRALERGFRDVAGRQRGVAASRRDAEHALARMNVDGLGQESGPSG